MSGIAELLLNQGYKVSGSDVKLTDITKRLETLGGKIFEGHREGQIAGADVVVTSSAVSHTNPEVIAARKESIPVIPRAEMLAELMRLKYSIAIAGAHGKTSTTSMVSSILGEGGLDPTVVIGGKLKSINTNAVLGEGEYIVAEADESDGSFLKFSPTIAVVTNIDREHLDLIDKIPFYGLAVLCLDNEPIQDLIPRIKKRFITYGLNTQADLQARHVLFQGPKSKFFVFYHGEKLGDVALNLPGNHNVNNALASIAVGLELGVPFAVIKRSLEKIEGVQRRLEIKGEKNGILVMDDYGHHPTEIMATLFAIRKGWPEKRLIVVFQPHRYTRTRDLYYEFTRSFYQSDVLVMLPIYAAGEKKIINVNARNLHQGIMDHGHKNAVFAEEKESAITYLKEILQSGDILLTLGAGDVWKIGTEVLRQLDGNVS